MTTLLSAATSIAHSVANAAPAAAAPAPNPMLNILFPAAMVAIFYFLVWRPSSVARKKHTETVNTAKRGDSVVTSGGLVGKITKAQEGSDQVTVEIAEGVTVQVVRATLASVTPKGGDKSKADTKDAKK